METATRTGTNGKTASRISLTPKTATWWAETETGEKKNGKAVYCTITGELIGRFEITRKGGKVEHYYQIADSVTGEIFNVNEKFDLRALAPFAGNGKRYTVDITPIEKISIGGGKTKWSYDVGVTEIL